ncbi:DUF308 domain-containing protein [Acinetobacter baumannii]|uniref:HdeD family acid-resistance protein n=1 Tax=Acinetobacter baumannii TaxID=470 RepID=UPI0020231C4A|nr:DUF308 domain-containing protein [Acinetobacter baumannii]MCL8296980.1 DUF308 domain-containing protein [Acinetobacter baumannii]
MKTVGNDLVRNQLHADRKWYLILGFVLIIFGLVLFSSLPFATFSVVFLFGILMMVGGVLHLIAALSVFKGGSRWLWALFGVLYLMAGYYAFSTPVTTAVVLTSLLSIALIIAGWGWTLFSGLLTLATGILILVSKDSPFWVLGMFLAVDILFQGINFLGLASAIKHLPSSSKTVS